MTSRIRRLRGPHATRGPQVADPWFKGFIVSYVILNRNTSESVIRNTKRRVILRSQSFILLKELKLYCVQEFTPAHEKKSYNFAETSLRNSLLSLCIIWSQTLWRKAPFFLISSVSEFVLWIADTLVTPLLNAESIYHRLSVTYIKRPWMSITFSVYFVHWTLHENYSALTQL
jgi:hypothetical protein